MDFRKNGQDHEKVTKFHVFGPKILCCLKTRNIFLVIEQNNAPKMLGFQQYFLCHEKFKLVMKK